MKKREKKDFLEFNVNECTTYLDSWDTVNAVLSGKFPALTACIKKWENSHTSDFIVQMKILEQKEAATPNRSRQQEIIKVRAEINRIETKKAMQRIN